MKPTYKITGKAMVINVTIAALGAAGLVFSIMVSRIASDDSEWKTVSTGAWITRVVSLEDDTTKNGDVRVCSVGVMDKRPIDSADPHHVIFGDDVCDMIDSGVTKGDVVARICDVMSRDDKRRIECRIEGW